MSVAEASDTISADLWIDAEIARARLEDLIAEAEPVLILRLADMVLAGVALADAPRIEPHPPIQRQLKSGDTHD
jgi:hypothetical protein